MSVADVCAEENEIEELISEVAVEDKIQDVVADKAEEVIAETGEENCVHHAFMAKVTEVDTDTSDTCSMSCNNCCELEDKIVKLKSHNLDLIKEISILKEAYDVLNKLEKEFKETIS